MKISVSSYSFQDKIDAGEMTLYDCITKAKEMGFEAIEICDFNLPGETAEEKKIAAKDVKAFAEKTGLVINGYIVNQAIFRDDAVEFMKGQLDIAKELGATLMRHDVCKVLSKEGDTKSFDLMLPKLIDSTRAVAEYAASLGIRTCSENHGRVSQDSERLERLYNGVNHDNYGILFDMGNFMSIGEDPISAVSRLAPYVIHAHVKDVKLRNKPYRGWRLIARNGAFCAPKVVGDGDVPIEQCIRALMHAGYDGYLAIENEAPGDCVKVMEKGIKRVKKYIANSEKYLKK